MSDTCRRMNGVTTTILAVVLFAVICNKYVKNIEYNNNMSSNNCNATDLSYLYKYRYGKMKEFYVVLGTISYVDNGENYSYFTLFKEFGKQDEAEKYINDNNNNLMKCYTNGIDVRINNELNPRGDLLAFTIIIGIILLLCILILCFELKWYLNKRYNVTLNNNINNYGSV